MRRILLFILILIVTSISQILAENLKPTKTINPPTIDGKLDDSIWLTASNVTGFKTFIPDFGMDMHEPTKTYMAYDDDNIYFAFKCFDSEPEKIKASLTNRDNIRSEDWICLNLDTFGDQQSLCAFYVNPLGVQGDAHFASGIEDEGIDFIWYSAGMIDEDGYSIEMKIPLESIRYSQADPVKMAVFFERKISRYREQGSYPALDPDLGYAFMTQLKPMVYEDLKGKNVFEILPAVTFNQKYQNEAGNLNLKDENKELSLTAKYGISSDLIIDATYNPDFSQVESDASEVEINLRSNLLYSEKRPFFLEGRENFNLSGVRASEVDPVYNIVHTRRIINPVAGGKLTGNLGEKSKIAILYALDDLNDIYSVDTSKVHYAVARYKRALSGDSYLGAIYAGKETEEYSNRVAGFDGAIRVSEAAQLEFNGFMSITKSDMANDLNGNSFALKYSLSSRNTDIQVAVNNVSKNFIADMGYVSRDGLQLLSALYRPKIYTENEFFQRIDLEAFSSVGRDLYYDKYETFNHVSADLLFGGTYEIKLKYSYSTETYKGEVFKTGGFHAFLSGHLSNNFYMGILYRYRGSILFSDNPEQGMSNVISANMIYHPTDQLENDFSFVFSDFVRSSDSKTIYSVPIIRNKLTFQLNKYLFVRGIVEYNNYYKELTTDMLASFTYIPGTVIHVGYGSIYNKLEWRETLYTPSSNFQEMRRGLFIKMSYLWRI